METKEKEITKKVITKEIKKAPVDNWEYEDRLYVLQGEEKPLTFTISCKHTNRHPLMYWDNEKKQNRELRYATNQNSPFVDEQTGTATLGHVQFVDGVLSVPKSQTVLQKLLSLYHPYRDQTYYEEDKTKEAVDELSWLEAEMQAMNLATEMDIDQLEAILRVEIGSKVSKMSSKEVKRDALLFARQNPGLFLELADDDRVELRNVAVKAAELNVIRLSADQRTWSWASNSKKLMQVPFEENPYSAMAAWFQTDEGLEVYKSIQKKLK